MLWYINYILPLLDGIISASGQVSIIPSETEEKKNYLPASQWNKSGIIFFNSGHETQQRKL